MDLLIVLITLDVKFELRQRPPNTLSSPQLAVSQAVGLE